MLTWLDLVTGTVTVEEFPIISWFWINGHRSKEVPVSALHVGWGLCTWFAALLVRVPLSIGASDLTGLSIGASNLIELCADWPPKWIRKWCHILFSTLHIDGLR